MQWTCQQETARYTTMLLRIRFQCNVSINIFKFICDFCANHINGCNSSLKTFLINCGKMYCQICFGNVHAHICFLRLESRGEINGRFKLDVIFFSVNEHHHNFLNLIAVVVIQLLFSFLLFTIISIEIETQTQWQNDTFIVCWK